MIHLVSNPISLLKYADAPDFAMLTYPVPMKDIKKFEKANNISVNVYNIAEVTQKKKKSHTAEEANTHVTAEEELSKTTYEVLCSMLYSFSFNLY